MEPISADEKLDFGHGTTKIEDPAKMTYSIHDLWSRNGVCESCGVDVRKKERKVALT